MARVPAAAEWGSYFALNSRSFRFAARFFPPGEWERVARVYAFCRVTDDLVDLPKAARRTRRRCWTSGCTLPAARTTAHATGIELLDRVMGETASAGVPFTYAAELAEGMRMDLRMQRYASHGRAARLHAPRGVRGGDVDHGAGRRPRAARAGQGGGDGARHAAHQHPARRGRRLAARPAVPPGGRDGAPRRDGGCASAACAGAAARRTPAYRCLVEELLRSAEASYHGAFAAIRELPAGFRRPVGRGGVRLPRHPRAHPPRGVRQPAPPRRDLRRRRRCCWPRARCGTLWRLERAPASRLRPDAEAREAAPVRLAGA